MTTTIKTQLEDYTLERVAVVEVAGRPELHGWYDGVECLLDGKPFMIAAGFVACDPLDPELALDWPMRVEVDLGGLRQCIDNATADPRAVASVRRFQEALAAGTAREGMNLEG